jgi:hypothetical protein
MPAVSQVQFRKMYALHNRGKISDEELKDFTHNVDYSSLPKKSKKNAAKRLLRKKNAERLTKPVSD